MNNTQLRNKVKQYKIKYGISYKSISQKVGLSEYGFRNWLNNEDYNYSIDTLQSINNYLSKFEGV